MQVSGSRSAGIARLLATQDGIAQLQVEADGRAITVNLSKSRFSSGSGGKSSYASSRDDDNIIEAEIIEKKTK